MSLPLSLSSLVTTSLFSISVTLLRFIILTNLYFLDSTNKCYHTVFVILWLISLSIMPSKSTHVAANGKISLFFYGSVTFIYIYLYHIYIYIYIPHLLYPFSYLLVFISTPKLILSFCDHSRTFTMWPVLWITQHTHTHSHLRSVKEIISFLLLTPVM